MGVRWSVSTGCREALASISCGCLPRVTAYDPKAADCLFSVSGVSPSSAITKVVKSYEVLGVIKVLRASMAQNPPPDPDPWSVSHKLLEHLQLPPRDIT